ncbi:12243_t:CDS:2 [Cetraspora pellucida]|uniref:12243_t:CDS:1 n=1 Tax=Cetraspora pellucida TaxID=1433469 RepID=A0ACA9KIU3_9GLOM|nr:12243_t:CDS:2 [Cetraspora pellucida]
MSFTLFAKNISTLTNANLNPCDAGISIVMCRSMLKRNTNYVNTKVITILVETGLGRISELLVQL